MIVRRKHDAIARAHAGLDQTCCAGRRVLAPLAERKPTEPVLLGALQSDAESEALRHFVEHGGQRVVSLGRLLGPTQAFLDLRKHEAFETRHVHVQEPRTPIDALG